MKKVLLLILIVISVDTFACRRLYIKPTLGPTEFRFLGECGKSIDCGVAVKWDFAYFSKDFFQIDIDKPFYSIKESNYYDNICLGAVRPIDTKYILLKGQKDSVVLLNHSCPKIGAQFKGEIKYQKFYRIPFHSCAPYYKTGRTYLKVASNEL